MNTQQHVHLNAGDRITAHSSDGAPYLRIQSADFADTTYIMLGSDLGADSRELARAQLDQLGRAVEYARFLLDVRVPEPIPGPDDPTDEPTDEPATVDLMGATWRERTAADEAGYPLTTADIDRTAQWASRPAGPVRADLAALARSTASTVDAETLDLWLGSTIHEVRVAAHDELVRRRRLAGLEVGEVAANDQLAANLAGRGYRLVAPETEAEARVSDGNR